MYYQAALRTKRMCTALTGLTPAEFTAFIPDFTYYYNELLSKRKKHRERKIGGGRNSKIDTIEEKLFYILWYMKTYPTFDVASFWVGFARSSACTWMHDLLPVLELTMKRKFVLPQRKISDPEEFLRLYPETAEVFVDGVERLKQRPKKKESAQKIYSGKKKAHTRKSVVVTDKKRRVLVVTKQKSGRRHDKRLADKEDIFRQLPKEVKVMADTGFVGSEKDHPNIFLPKKKPKGRELTAHEKEINKIISSYRVIVEHAIGGIKRYRCMSEKLRNHKSFIDDQFLLLSAGLWNYHLAST
jgi:DDE superfamily endonuclease/Helix-turn-helix of DDE superfamily endonuclease